ncbi:transcription elongation factor S-II [Sporothrix schenckii 1099-18]|uniref:Transcription elongation factor n=2 Tax=Sporothrix schenckii TaxID=29908 RepID=U7Q4Q9_SPOS1|nr:transcription elongation factor S-II [Sporothrix schenckii 1099-18]ERT02167.1 transcription elongation factor S-II [Sporothrix schenckii ATCC 58251]KJR80620.1 transcription elongation factor S-II [Sporothrix schenckii 1099-18]
MSDKSIERELTTRIKALNKAVTSNEPVPGILAIMETLKKGAAPSEEVLRSTKAGHIVGKLRTHANAEVKSMAAEIVSKWRKAVEASKKKGGTGTGSTAGSTTASKTASPSASTPQSKTASPAPATSGRYKGDPEKRKFDVDGVDVNRTGIQSRDNCIGLMYNGLAYRSVEATDVILVKAIEVEKAAFVAYKGETTEYRAKLRSLFQNLKNRSNPALARRVVSGEISPDVFVVMTSDELKSAHLKQLESDLAKENMKKAQVPMTEKSISDALTCSKCKQKKVSYTQAQTRSADEPMTTFCECMVCGHRWKFS